MTVLHSQGSFHSRDSSSGLIPLKCKVRCLCCCQHFDGKLLQWTSVHSHHFLLNKRGSISCTLACFLSLSFSFASQFQVSVLGNDLDLANQSRSVLQTVCGKWNFKNKFILGASACSNSIPYGHWFLSQLLHFNPALCLWLAGVRRGSAGAGDGSNPWAPAPTQDTPGSCLRGSAQLYLL